MFAIERARELLLIILKFLKRYLRATKWNSANVAIERLEGTLKWRREYGIYDMTAEHVEPEVSFFLLAHPWRL